MMGLNIKGAVFDIGQTLVNYPFPLNWSALYRPAFENVSERYGLDINEHGYRHIGEILAKYNTRINPREKEVSSDIIFSEILDGTGIAHEHLEHVKNGFYSYFRNDARIYDDVPEVLKEIHAKGIITATLSDVAYGMDNVYALDDIREAAEFIDIPFTSNDSGYRKPCGKGLTMLSEKMGIPVSEMVFVGDEKKDVECALNAGVHAVLIDRDGKGADHGQEYTINSFDELLDIIV